MVVSVSSLWGRFGIFWLWLCCLDDYEMREGGDKVLLMCIIFDIFIDNF